MPSYATALVQLIDDRIDRAQLKPTKMGTVQEREGGTARVIVTFDGGSGVGQPVKCFETVVVDIGDRVGLIKFEGEWIVVGNYTPRTLGDSLSLNNVVSTGTTTSATYVDMPGSPGTTFAKYRDATQLQLILMGSAFSDATSTSMDLAVLLTLPDTTTIDQPLFDFRFNTAGVHTTFAGGITTPGLTLPAGPYTAIGRWRRPAGSGVLTMDSSDSVTVWVREVPV